MTIGETIAPKIIPNLNQSKLSGVKNFEFNSPKIKKKSYWIVKSGPKSRMKKQF